MTVQQQEKEIWGGYIFNMLSIIKSIVLKLIPFLGLELISFISISLLFVLDFILDLIIGTEYKKTFMMFLLKSFYFFSIIFILKSFCVQWGIIYTSILYAVINIYLLDTLFNVFKSLNTITKETVFTEITSYVGSILKSFIKKQTDIEDKKDDTTK